MTTLKQTNNKGWEECQVRDKYREVLLLFLFTDFAKRGAGMWGKSYIGKRDSRELCV
jgi:hypothetical protein